MNLSTEVEMVPTRGTSAAFPAMIVQGLLSPSSEAAAPRTFFGGGVTVSTPVVLGIGGALPAYTFSSWASIELSDKHVAQEMVNLALRLATNQVEIDPEIAKAIASQWVNFF